jgi:hypothetical protein
MSIRRKSKIPTVFIVNIQGIYRAELNSIT